jgi:hypothetical protein
MIPTLLRLLKNNDKYSRDLHIKCSFIAKYVESLAHEILAIYISV